MAITLEGRIAKLLNKNHFLTQDEAFKLLSFAVVYLKNRKRIPDALADHLAYAFTSAVLLSKSDDPNNSDVGKSVEEGRISKLIHNLGLRRGNGKPKKQTRLMAEWTRYCEVRHSTRRKKGRKLPYGIDVYASYANDPPWIKLKTIQEYLEDCEVIPPNLAYWLGTAINHCGENPKEFLKWLDLSPWQRGKPPADKTAWLKYGGRICHLENCGMKPEAALNEVAKELNDGNDEKYSRTQLQTFRNRCRKFLEPFSGAIIHNPRKL